MNLTLLCFWIIPILINWLQAFSRQKTIENNSAWVFSNRLCYFGCCVFNPHCQVSINKSATWSIWLLPSYYPVITILLSNSPKQAIFLHGADTLPWWITCPVLFKIVKGKSRELHLQRSVLYPNSFCLLFPEDAHLSSRGDPRARLWEPPLQMQTLRGDIIYRKF